LETNGFEKRQLECEKSRTAQIVAVQKERGKSHVVAESQQPRARFQIETESLAVQLS